MIFDCGPVLPLGCGDGATLAIAVFGISNHCPGARLETQEGVTTGGGGAGGSAVTVGVGVGVAVGVGTPAVADEPAAESAPPPHPQRAEVSSEASRRFLIVLLVLFEGQDLLVTVACRPVARKGIC